MVLKDDVIAQSALLIPEQCQSGFLALLAKFDFAIPCSDKHVFVHCLLPEELDSSTKHMTEGATRRSALMPNIFKIYKGLTSSFSEMIEAFASKISEHQENKLRMRTSVLIPDEVDLHQNCMQLNDCHNIQDHHGRQQFPHFSIMDSAAFENSINLSSSSHQSNEKQWLKSIDINPVLHPPLRRVWLATFIPDGFWPHLLAKIILDDAICDTLSAILSTALETSEYTLSYARLDAVSLWKLSRLGLAVEYDQIKLIELMQTTNVCDNSSDKYNLSERHTYQIELTIHTRDIVLVHKQEIDDEVQDLKADVIRLATRILVMIEQHLMDIGEEWFPGTITDSHSNQILSFVPCPLCVSKNDHTTSYDDCAGQWFLQWGNHKVVCFSCKRLLDAYALPSRSVKCPLHNEMLVEQVAPDLVSNYIVHSCY